jgi:hypothetical protein
MNHVASIRNQAWLLEVLHAAVLAENAQLAGELELATAAWRQEREMRLASERKLKAMRRWNEFQS